MIGCARLLGRLGYSVFLIDLPAHVESDGSHITYGFLEADGVETALAFLSQEFRTEKIGVIGVSLGAAALVRANPSPAPDAMVLESMLPTIEEAVRNRLALRFGSFGAWLEADEESLKALLAA